MEVNASIYSGIDGCRKGWLMVSISALQCNYSFLPEINDLERFSGKYGRILIDIPIGLLHEGLKSYAQRPCDAAARRILGKKHSSVFSPPTMEALFEKSYQQASETNFRILGKKLSKQSWNIAPRIREVNAFLHLNPPLRKYILEAHPEMSFQFLNNNIPLQHSKKTAQGIEERLTILSEYFIPARECFDRMRSDQNLKGKAQQDDMADALVLAVLNHVRKDRLQNICAEYPEDSLGNRMGIWL